MNRPFLKTSVVAIVSLGLLYYSVAWAMLRCPHQENHSDYEVASYNTGAHETEFSFSSPSDVQAELDCPGPNYHIESLAGSSAPSELLRLIRDVTPQMSVFFPSSSIARAQDLWLKALFDTLSSPPFSFDLRRYLSLSVLRL